MENNAVEGWYYFGAIISGILIFAGTWIYAMGEWGFLWGIIFGWIPALIAGVVGGFIWPILAIIILICAVSAYN